MSIGLRRNPAMWGFYPEYVGDRSTANLNAAASWAGFSFVLDSAKTLNKVRMYATSSGSPVAADYRCELYSSVTSGPSAPLASLETAAVPASVANGAWIEWTGLTTALDANTMYWIVFKNLNGTPATNYYTPNSHGEQAMYSYIGGSEQGSPWGWCRRISSNSGTSWSTSIPAVAGLRLEFSDGSFEGLPVGGRGQIQVYSSREAGAYFVSPDVALNVKGMALQIRRSSSPTGDPRYRLYLGNTNAPTLQGTTGSPVRTQISNATLVFGYVPLFFNSVITIPPSSVVRVVLSETTQSDASTNRFEVNKWDMENDANTKALLGSYQSTLSTDGGATFSQTDTDLVPFALFLTTQAGTTVGGSEFGSAKNLPLLRYRRGHLVRI